jgi:hypothetical protein
MATVSKNGAYAIPLSSGKTWKTNVSEVPKPLKVDGPWEVVFNKEGGYGGKVKFNTLMDWKSHPIDSINYYSGTANYTKTVNISGELLDNDTKAVLDLGTVHIVAEVKINGNRVAVSWMPPFKMDITKYLKAGSNQLEIAVTNQWSNRLIGDERYPANDGGYKLEGYRPKGKMPQWYINNEPRPAGKRTTFTTASFYKKDDPLMPSGLIGPVKIDFSKTLIIEP